MTVHVQWENSRQTAIRVTFDPQWRWQDYDASVDEVRQMLRSVDHTVDIISDIRTSTPQTQGLAWNHFRRTFSDIPHNIGMVVIAGRGHFTASIFSLVVQSDPRLVRRTRFVSTIAEAHSVLRQHANPLHTLN
ncbi:MAG: hypothetical protein KF716_25435 [Anaerolineae bacterium]|nr:hypothetical protein [Anaerolineae bacterium]